MQERYSLSTSDQYCMRLLGAETQLFCTVELLPCILDHSLDQSRPDFQYFPGIPNLMLRDYHAPSSFLVCFLRHSASSAPGSHYPVLIHQRILSCFESSILFHRKTRISAPALLYTSQTLPLSGQHP